MKKQLRLVLFAALVVVMVMMTVLVASAATDGATAQEEGHYFYVTDANGTPTETPFYATLDGAVTAVPNGGIVYVIGDVTLTAPVTLDASKSYTVNGAVADTLSGVTKGTESDSDGRYAISGSYLVIGTSGQGEETNIHLKNLAVTNTAVNALATYSLGAVELTSCAVTSAGSPVVLMDATNLYFRGSDNVVTNTLTTMGSITHSVPASNAEGGAVFLPRAHGCAVTVEGGTFSAPYIYYAATYQGDFVARGGTFHASGKYAFYLYATAQSTESSFTVSGATVYADWLLYLRRGNYKTEISGLTFNLKQSGSTDKPTTGIEIDATCRSDISFTLSSVILDVTGTALLVERRAGATVTVKQSNITAGEVAVKLDCSYKTTFNVTASTLSGGTYGIYMLGDKEITSIFTTMNVNVPATRDSAAIYITEDVPAAITWNGGAITGAATQTTPVNNGIYVAGKQNVSVSLNGVTIQNVYIGVCLNASGSLALSVNKGSIEASCIAIYYQAQAAAAASPSSILIEGATLQAEIWTTIRLEGAGTTDLTVKSGTVKSSADSAIYAMTNGKHNVTINGGTFIGGRSGCALDIRGSYSLAIADGTFKRQNPQSNHNIVNLQGECRGVLISGGLFHYEDTPETEYAIGENETKLSIIKGDFATLMVRGTCTEGATMKITGGTFRHEAENVYGYCMWFEATGLPVIFEEAEGSTILVEAYASGIRINTTAATSLSITGGTYRANLSTATREELEALGYMDITKTTGEGENATTETVSGGITWRLTNDTNPTIYAPQSGCALTLNIIDATIVNPKACAIRILGGDNTCREITLVDMTVYAYSLLRIEAGRYDITAQNVIMTKASDDPESTAKPQYIFDVRKGTQLTLTIDGGNYVVGTKNGICIPLNTTSNKVVLTDTDGREYTGVVTIKGGAVMSTEAKILNISNSCISVKVELLDCTLTSVTGSAMGAVHTNADAVQEGFSDRYRTIVITGATIAGYNAIRMAGGQNILIIESGTISSNNGGSAVYGTNVAGGFYDVTILGGSITAGTLGNCFDLRVNYKLLVEDGTLIQDKAENYYHIFNLQGTCYGIEIKGGIFQYIANPDPRKEDGTWVSGTGSIVRIYGDVARDPEGNPIAEAVISGGDFRVSARGVFTSESNKKSQTYSCNIYFMYHSATDVTVTISNVTVISMGGIYLNGDSTVNIESGTFTNKPIVKNATRFIVVAKDGAVLNVSGGTFYGNANSYVMFSLRTKGAELHMTGGLVDGGGRWINQEYPSLVTLGGTVEFRNCDANNGFQLNKNATGEIGEGRGVSRMEITGGTYTIPINAEFPLFVMTGAEVIISGGKFETTYTMFQLSSNKGVGTVRISDGEFMIHDNGSMFHYVVNLPDTNPQESIEMLADMPGLIHITGGSFASESTATIFRYSPQHTGAQVIVDGGTFDTLMGWIVTMDNANSNFVINSGTFTTHDATSMFQIGQGNGGTFYIKGGAFYFEDTDQLSKKADTALLYSAGKSKSSVVIEGGTFYDHRVGSKQTFLKLNDYGTLEFRGDFKVYVANKKDYFYQNYAALYDDSILMTTLTPIEYVGNYNYYVLEGRNGGYAPVMIGNPVVRPGFKDIGITFVSNVSKTSAEELAKLGTVSYGTLIFPTQYLSNWNKDTDFLAALKAYAVSSGKAEDKVFLMIAAENGLTTNADGSLTIRASLINIKEENKKRDFTGIAYAKVTAADGTETYYWATANNGASTTTFAKVLKGALNDTASRVKYSTDGKKAYCYAIATGGNGYSRYPAKMQEVFMDHLKED